MAKLPEALEAILYLLGECIIQHEALLEALHEKGINIDKEYEERINYWYTEKEKKVKMRKRDWSFQADWAARCLNPEDMDALISFFANSEHK